MRARFWIASVAAVLVACSFGVDLDNLVGGAADGGPIIDGARTDAPSPTPSDARDEEAVLASVDIAQLGTGTQFSCVRKTTGEVDCWGRGTEGRLGDGLATSVASPVVVRDLTDAIDLSVGSSHACAIKQNGNVYCWGNNASAQLGDGTTGEGRTPVLVSKLTSKSVQVSAGGTFTCARLEDATVSCWGDNSRGQLGNGVVGGSVDPTVVKALSDVKQIAAAANTACALTNPGEVYCWGDNGSGQVGLGDAGTVIVTATKVDSLSGVSSLSIGGTGEQFCAVIGDGGEVRCWGRGDQGQLGTGFTASNPLPTKVENLTEPVAGVTTGSLYSCALYKSGSAACWGNNGQRVFGRGDSAPSSNTPLPAEGIDGTTQFAAGAGHACALIGKREVRCWGNDTYGCLGRKRPLTSNVAVQVVSPTAYKQVSLGRSFACATEDGGALSCWGDNAARQQARGDFTISGQPGVTPSIAAVARLGAGDGHACAVLADGGVRCWGAQDNGALGNGSTSSSSSVGNPVVFPTPEAIDVGGGATYTCALLKGGMVMCAGSNGDGRVGSPIGGNVATPRVVLSLDDAGATVPFDGVSALAVGRTHVCAIYNKAKNLACWGSNENGQIGQGTPATSPLPLEVPGLKSPVEVALGYRHTCVRLADTTTRCFGRNVNGQLTGTGGTGAALRTVDFGSERTAIALALGDDHSCAVLDDGTVRCWGAGAFGQLGNGANADSNVPVVVQGVSGASAINAREAHTCAIAKDGTYCWGTDFSGQLGVAPTMLTGVPAGVEGL